MHADPGLREVADLTAFIERRDDGLYTDSRGVALVFGRRHHNVLRAIDAKRNSGSGRIAQFYCSNFQPTTYTDKKGRPRRMFIITSAGMEALTGRFTGDDARELRMRLDDGSSIDTGRDRRQFLYVMVSESGLCKVGIARDVESRRATLEAMSGYRLTVVRTFGPFHAAGRLERLIHRSLGAHRKVGEWFACTAQIAVEQIEAARALFGDAVPDDEQQAPGEQQLGLFE